MKNKHLCALLALGIIASAAAAYHLRGSNYSIMNNQLIENDLDRTSEASEKSDPDGPGEAYLWRSLAWKDEYGQVPPNAFEKAVKQRDKYLQQQSAPDGFSDGAVAHLNWTSRGPQNVGGRTRSVIVHPNDPNTIWAGSVGGGVWKSTNGGQTWTATNSNLQNFAVSSMAIDPNNPNVLYAGTGEGFFNGDALRGAGIFKTTDGGMNWSQLSSTVPQPYPNDFNWSAVDRISIAQNNSNLILAGTRGGIMRSTDGGSSWTRVRGTYTSLFVAFNPTDSSKAVAEIIDYDPGWHHRAIYSTDSGNTWQNSYRDGSEFKLIGFLERVELAYSRSNPSIVYALNPSSGGGVVSRSTDGGQNFTSMASQSNAQIGGSLWYSNTLWVSPTDPNFLIAGGYELHKSTNGGDNFTQIADGYLLTTQPHPDQHCIVPDPGYNGTSNKRVYVCNDGGVFRTDDITTANKFGSGGWEQLSSTFQTTQYYGAAGNGTTGLIYGGTQDNGTLRLLPGNPIANLPYGGDGGFAAVDPADDRYCYGEYVYLQIHRSIDHGVSAQNIFSGITEANTSQTNFISPFILDPNEPNRMLAGGRSLWRTNNVRGNGQAGSLPAWTSIKPGGSDNISAIAVAAGNPSIIWVAQNDGKVYKTNNGLAANPTWTTVDDNGSTNPLPNRYITRILIDKDNSNTVYVSLGGFTDGNLQKSTDGGASWQNITGTNLPDVPIRGIARHPNDSNKLYIGTEIGVFTTENNGARWNAVLDGPANVSVDELAFMSNSTTLIAATHGRGVWTTDVNTQVNSNRTLFDFDGDGRADTSVFRPSDRVWYLNRSTAGFTAMQWGLSTDKPVAGDYDGDGKTDITVWRPADGVWYRVNSSNGALYSVQFGMQGDIPIPADYDGDGKTDEAVFRPSQGVWYLNQSTAGFSTVSWGLSADLPSAADFDGDGKSDQAVFRPSDGVWYLRQSTNGIQYVRFGLQGDLPVVADYDGDGKADVAVWRPSDRVWYLNRSSAGFFAVQWGLSNDKPVPADYDGDGKADVAVWRPSDGVWYLMQSTSGMRYVQFGSNGDIPTSAKP